MSRWRPAPEALALLESCAVPTARPAVGRRIAACEPVWHDVSTGAVLADGTRAALPLLQHDDGRVVGLPYVGAAVVSDRALAVAEWRDLLHLVRRRTGARSVTVRAVAWGEAAGRHVGGRVTGWTHVVRTTGPAPIESRLSYKARRAVRTAREAGATTHTGTDAGAFLALYEQRSSEHWWRAPRALVEGLVDDGVARVHEVRHEGRTVSAVLALESPSHRVAWLAAQDEHGRSLAGNYLALAGLLEDARTSGVQAVDLMPSTGLAGVGHFKDRFDGTAVPMLEYAVLAPPAAARLTGTLRRAARSVRRAAGQRSHPDG